MPDYVPATTAGLLDWSKNFSSILLNATPQACGLTPADAQRIAEVVEAYQAAYRRADAPETRTRSAIVVRNGASREMLQVLRPYANLIRANMAVADSLKINLRLKLPAQGRQRVPVPDTRPLLEIVAVDLCRHRLHCFAEGNTEGPWKPAGVVGMQLFCHVGTSAPADPLDARFERLVTRPRHVVHFKPEQVGKKAFYVARWQTARGDTGPWSPFASRMISG